MRIVFDRKALADIANIHRWISEEWPAATSEIVARLYQSIERLVVFPSIGRAGTDPGMREWIVAKTPYVAIHEIHKASDELRVLAVSLCAEPTHSGLSPAPRH